MECVAEVRIPYRRVATCLFGPRVGFRQPCHGGDILLRTFQVAELNVRLSARRDAAFVRERRASV